jgi:hypothetical protein
MHKQVCAIGSNVNRIEKKTLWLGETWNKYIVGHSRNQAEDYIHLKP